MSVFAYPNPLHPESCADIYQEVHQYTDLQVLAATICGPQGPPGPQGPSGKPGLGNAVGYLCVAPGGSIKWGGSNGSSCHAGDTLVRVAVVS
jgi:hypothetical protein